MHSINKETEENTQQTMGNYTNYLSPHFLLHKSLDTIYSFIHSLTRSLASSRLLTHHGEDGMAMSIKSRKFMFADQCREL
jgi:hypothetical protein